MTRVSDQSIYSMADFNIDTAQDASVRANTISDTGLANVSASDDPVWANALATTSSGLNQIKTYDANIAQGTAQLQASDSALGEASNTLQSIYALAIQMSNGTYTAADQTNAIAQVNSLKQTLISVANTKSGNDYIFGGFKNSTPPFDSSGNFSGDASSQTVQVTSSSSVVINASGANAFTAAGGQDIFAAISNFATALSTNNSAGIEAAVGNMKSAITQVNTELANVGANENALSAATTQNQDAQQIIQNIQTQTVDANQINAYTNMTETSQALQSALEVSAKSFGLSLASYLST